VFHHFASKRNHEWIVFVREADSYRVRHDANCADDISIRKQLRLILDINVCLENLEEEHCNSLEKHVNAEWLRLRCKLKAQNQMTMRICSSILESPSEAHCICNPVIFELDDIDNSNTYHSEYDGNIDERSRFHAYPV
jgi:hypothetical protein